jgi:hypothetical protein
MQEIADDGTETEATTSLTSTDPKEATISKSGLFAITATDSTKAYASWTTTVYVES